METFDLRGMLQMQSQLQEKYKDKWGGVYPERGKDQLLWMLGEAGEVIDIIKMEGHRGIMEDASVRTHFIEELCDVLMYFGDVMLCYDISAGELERVYVEKFRKNMDRW